MKLTPFLLVCALLGSSTAWSHGSNPDHGKRIVIREQQAWGIAGEPAKSARTIELTMGDDMRFTPDRITVREGETVRLRVHNTGRLLHELVIGTAATLQAHAAQMLRFPNMEHDEPYMAHVAPGSTGEIVWTFNRAGDFEFACLVAGHFQAGMRGSLRVVAAPQSAAGRPLRDHDDHPMPHQEMPHDNKH